MQAERKNGNYHLCHKGGAENEFPQIGNTNVSCTTIPQYYSYGSLTFYDPPGFMDSKGVNQEILNAFANSKMFRPGMRAKICIVI